MVDRYAEAGRMLIAQSSSTKFVPGARAVEPYLEEFLRLTAQLTCFRNSKEAVFDKDVEILFIKIGERIVRNLHHEFNEVLVGAVSFVSYFKSK